MKFICKFSNFLWLTLLTVSCNNDINKNWEAKLDDIIERSVIQNGPGGVVGVFQGNDPLYIKAFGYADIDLQKENTPNTLFDIASCSKQFTAASIIILSENGKIDLDNPIQSYFPEFIIEKPIPIRSLLTHSSGIHDYSEMLLLARGRSESSSYSKQEILETIFNQESLSFNPMTDQNYSNSNFVILAELVERVSGTTFEEFVRINFLKPLNISINEIQFLGAKNDDTIQFATGYPRRKSGISNFNNINLSSENENTENEKDQILGASGMKATIYGLAKWMGNLSKNKIEDESLIRLLIQKDTLINGSLTQYSRGLETGITPQGYTWIEHTGKNVFTSVMLYWPDYDISMIALMNTQEIWAQSITNEICMDILAAFPKPSELFQKVLIPKESLVSKPIYKTKVNPPIELSMAELKKFTGTYPADTEVGGRKPPSGGVGINRIVFENNQLQGIRYDGLKFDLIPISKTALRVINAPIELHFIDLDTERPGIYSVENKNEGVKNILYKLKAMPEADRKNICGSFICNSLPKSIPVEIFEQNQKLFMQWGENKNKTELHYVETNRLTTYSNKVGEEMQCNLIIEKDENNKIIGVSYEGNRVWNLTFQKQEKNNIKI